MTVLAMSAAEITRFDTLMRLDRGEIRVADVMELLGLQRRQVYRLLDRLRQEGAAGLVSRKRGRPSNRRYSDAFRAEVVALVRGKLCRLWADARARISCRAARPGPLV